MNYLDALENTSDQLFEYIRVPPARDVPGLEEDARSGLLSQPRSLPPKYFYDDCGTELFEKICKTSEYYPTRTEDFLLKRHAKDIIETAKPNNIFELGSGSSTKTQRLLDACSEIAHFPSYTAFDISERALMFGGMELSKRYDWLQISLLLGDYEAGFMNVPRENGSRLVLFLGSTIGNFEQKHAIQFMKDLRNNMSQTDRLLVGFDRVKDRHILDAAYNDSQGITAAFNLNVLNVLNSELGANFEPKNFSHLAQYDADKAQIEMHLVSSCAQRVMLNNLREFIDMDAGERIQTEISRKFTDQSLTRLLSDSGFVVKKDFVSPDEYFSLVLAKPI